MRFAARSACSTRAASIKSFRNLARVEITVPSELEVHQLVRAQSLLITEPALEQVQGKAS